MRTPILATILLIWPAAAVADKNSRSYAFYQPVTDAERQMKAPVVDPNAGVEALFWRVHVWDERFVQRVMHHYVRLKIFSEKGKEKASTIDISYGPQEYITDISGRTIKPDGTILELSKDAVRERDVIRAGGLKVHANRSRCRRSNWDQSSNTDGKRRRPTRDSGTSGFSSSGNTRSRR